jgi:hypothetical protein
MSISRRNNRALNRVLRDSLRAHTRTEPPPEPEPKTPAYTLSTDIPDSYNDSYVKAIPKDPQSAFVYWELPKERMEGSLFADKGTAHVGNDEAVRIGEQLNVSQKADNCTDHNRNESHQNGYHQVNWDNGNRFNFDDTFRPPQYNQENYHQISWDNGARFNFDGDSRHYIDNYREVNWDNGSQYRFDGGDQQYRHNADNYNQVNRDGGDQYRIADAYLRHIHLKDGVYQINWNDGGGYAPINRDDRSAFSAMLEALIERCKRYIADYRQSGIDPLARALSSGLFSKMSKEPRP